MPATRREVLEAVERLWDQYPHQRFGQLVTNIGIFAGREPGDVYDLDSDEIVEAISRHLGPE